MSDYDENTLNELADMNYKVQLEEIGIRARPIRSKDLVTDTKFAKEMMDNYGKLYNQPIETIDPLTGEVQQKRYQQPIDMPDLETVDATIIGPDYDLMAENNEKIETLNTYLLDVTELMNKNKLERKIKYLNDVDELNASVDKYNGLLTTRKGYTVDVSIPEGEKKNRIMTIDKFLPKLEKKMENLEKDIENYDNDVIGINLPNYFKGNIPANELIKRILYDRDILSEENKMEYDKLEPLEAEKKRVAKINQGLIENYKNVLNTLNSSAFKMEQAQGESEEDYLNRINENASQPYNENLFFNASIDSIDKLKKNLKDVTKNESLAEGIINGLKPEERYAVNKYWGEIKLKLLRIYGYNNTSITSIDYLETIDKILTDTETNVKQKSQKSVMENVINIRDDKSANKGIINIKDDESLTEDDVSQYESKGEELDILKSYAGNKYADVGNLDVIQKDNILEVNSQITGKSIFIKLGILSRHNKNPVKLVLVSRSGENGTFEMLLERFTKINKQLRKGIINFDNIEEILGLPKKDILSQLCDIKDNIDKDEVDRMWDYLTDRYTLADENITVRNASKKNDSIGDNLKGWGIKNDDVPKMADFGNVKILLNKLFYKSILSVKDKKSNNIHGFPAIRVSQPFVDIVMKLFNGDNLSKNDLNILPTNEHELYDRLMYISGLKKSNATSIDTTIDEIKKRVELVQGQIEAGNNNKDLLNELTSLLNKLVNFGVLTRNQMKKHITLIEHDFF